MYIDNKFLMRIVAKRLATSLGIIGIVIGAIYLLTGCATKNEVNDLDVGKLEIKGKSSDGVIGINEKRQGVIREEKQVADELRVQEMVNYSLKEKADHTLFELKRCRKDLADPRLGGDGHVPKVPEIDSLQSPAEVREEMGLDEDSGDYKIVRETYVNDKLASERKYEKSLRVIQKVADEHLEECETTMALARRKAGLPSKRIEGDGYFLNDGTWVQTHRNESDLDDAFEITSINQRRAPAEEKAKIAPSAAVKTDRQEIEDRVNAMFDNDRG